MAMQQLQGFCHRCGQERLHTRDVYQVPHIFHLFVTLLLCGFWLPIWILHAASNATSGQPFRCGQCGQVLGRITEEQKAEQLRHGAELRQRTAAVREGRAREREAGLLERGRERRREGRGTTQPTAVGRSLGRGLREFPGRVDRLLETIAGEGNTILYRFLQLLAIAAIAAVVALLCILIAP